jgi:hypothetical protein
VLPAKAKLMESAGAAGAVSAPASAPAPAAP